MKMMNHPAWVIKRRLCLVCNLYSCISNNEIDLSVGFRLADGRDTSQGDIDLTEDDVGGGSNVQP